jgi:Dynein light chain type 1
MAEQRKAVIKNADMSEAMQQDAVDIASAALSKYNIEKARFTLYAPTNEKGSNMLRI